MIGMAQIFEKGRAGRRLFMIAMSVCAISIAVPAHADKSKSQDYYKDALEWLQKGDGRAPLIQLRNAIKEDPDNFSARLLLGRLYLESRNLPAARKELEIAHRGSPSDETEVFLGQVMVGMRDYEGALNVVSEAANDAAFGPPKILVRAEAQFGLNRFEESAATAQKLLNQQKNNPPANLLLARIKIVQNDPAAAQQYIDASLLGDPKFVEAYLLRAQLAYSSREMGEVLAILDKAQELAPNDPRPKLLRAEALLRIGKLDDALKIVNEYKTNAGDPVRSSYLLARIYATQGKYEEADRELRQIAEAVRVVPAASLLSGIVKFQLEQYAQAEDALARYVTATGDEARQARRLLATVQLRTLRPRAALQTLEPLIGESSRDVASMQLAASAFLRTNELDESKSMFARIMQQGSQVDVRQAQAFYQALQSGKPNVVGKLTLDPVALRSLTVLDMLRHGEEASAFNAAKALSADAPDDTSVMNLLAGLYIGRGELVEARKIMEASLAKAPNNIASMRMMDRIDVAEGKFDAIESRLRGALEANPSDEQLIIRMAQFLSQRNRREEALSFLDEKAKSLPDSVLLRATLINSNAILSKMDTVRVLADQAFERGTKGDTASLEIAADAYMSLRDFPKAIDAYSKLAAKSDKPDGSLLKMARAQFLANDFDTAKLTLDRILTGDPANALANRAMVELQLRRNDPDAALVAADKAVAANAILGLQLRAEVLRKTNRIAAAITEMRAGLVQYPVSALAQQAFRLLMEAKKEDDAKALLQAWLVDHPDDPEALQLLSTAQILARDYDDAAVYLERAFSLLPNNPVVLNNLAWVRYELKRPGALAVARRAYRLAPNSAAIADTLGWILVQEGEIEEAIKLLYTAADAAPKLGDIVYHLAFALNKAGKKADAVKVLEPALQSGTDVEFDQEGEKAKALLSTLKAG